jgi:hypothetical protein
VPFTLTVIFLHAALCFALNSLSNFSRPPLDSVASVRESVSPVEFDNVEFSVDEPALSSSPLFDDTDVSALPGANNPEKNEALGSSLVSFVSIDGLSLVLDTFRMVPGTYSPNFRVGCNL